MWRSLLPAAALLCSSAVEGRSTEWQLKLLTQLKADAARRSSAASGALEEQLGSGELRQALEACAEPDVARLPAHELARRLREEVSTVEIISGFSSEGYPGYGMSLDEAVHGPGYLESNWQVGVRWKSNFSGGEGWFTIQDDVETKLYGFRPFQQTGYPHSMQEASERTPYFLANLFRVDAGSPLYGDISVVLAPQLATSASVVSAVDTGGWTAICNSSTQPSWLPDGYKANCSAYPKFVGLGTLDHFDHLLLTNSGYWRGSLSRVACRLLAPWGTVPVVGSDLVHYWEAMPAAELTFPGAIKFVIAAFPSLFGSGRGRQLQEWCQANGWVLVWSLGLNVETDANFWTAVALAPGQWSASDQRLADPEVLARTAAGFNTTALPPGAGTAAFAAAWKAANASREAAVAKNTTVSNATWAAAWSSLKESLPVKLQLRPLQAGACGDVERCIGSEIASGDCLCYHDRSSAAALIV